MTAVLATEVAKELVELKSQALLEGKCRDDIMSLLGKPASLKAVLFLLTSFPSFPKLKPTHLRTRIEG